jgi:hypothetical protein
MGHEEVTPKRLTIGPNAGLAHKPRRLAVVLGGSSNHLGHKNQRKLLILVRLAGIEPTTLGFGGQYSIH